MASGWLVAARAIHIAGCLLLFGLLAFERLVFGAMDDSGTALVAAWHRRVRRWSALTLPWILLSGAGWLVLVAAAMSGMSVREVLRGPTLATVWSQTDFGSVWQWRAVFGLAVVILAVVGRISWPWLNRGWVSWVRLVAAALLLGSLSWTGHGRDGPGWHRWADTAHLLAAGCWPTGLLPLGVLLLALRREPGVSQWRTMHALARRFSTVSLASVGVLIASGWLDAVPLVGRLGNLVRAPYGNWLLAKIVLLSIALAIAAVNLLYLEPRLLAEPAVATRAAARLQRNVWYEFVLGAAVIAIVAVLGTLSPPLR